MSSRREFLKTAAFATASLSLAGAIPSFAVSSKGSILGANDRIRLGVSPRGSIALMRASQAKAAVSGRDYVIPEDVKAVAADVLCHRISCKGATHNQMETAKAIIDNILATVQAPAIR